MRKIGIVLAAVLAVALLNAANAQAFGRRCRGGGCSSGSCGGTMFYSGGCGDYGYGGYGGTASGWNGSFGPTIMPAPLSFTPLSFTPVATPTAAPTAPTVMPAPGTAIGGTANAVYALDPRTGVLHQVGWQSADGSLRGLSRPAAGEAVPATTQPQKQR